MLREGRRLVQGEPKFKVGILSLVSSRPASYAPAWGLCVLGGMESRAGNQVSGVGGYVYLCCGYFVAALRIYLKSPR